MQNHKYIRDSIRVGSLSCLNFATDPNIIGFSNLLDLLRWQMNSKRSLSSVSKEFLPSDIKEIYYQANPIIFFRRDKINIEKLEKIFLEFQEKRNHKKEIIQNMPDDPLFELPDYEDPLAYLNENIEKYKTERFLRENPQLKYFAICNMTKVEVTRNESEIILNKTTELDDIINSASNLIAFESKWQNENFDSADIRDIEDDLTENYLGNDIDSGWQRLDDNPYYNSDIEMDEQSQEFWDNL